MSDLLLLYVFIQGHGICMWPLQVLEPEGCHFPSDPDCDLERSVRHGHITCSMPTTLGSLVVPDVYMIVQESLRPGEAAAAGLALPSSRN